MPETTGGRNCLKKYADLMQKTELQHTSSYDEKAADEGDGNNGTHGHDVAGE